MGAACAAHSYNGRRGTALESRSAATPPLSLPASAALARLRAGFFLALHGQLA